MRSARSAGFAVDASVIEADANRFQRIEGSEIEWSEEQLARRAIKEYVDALNRLHRVGGGLDAADLAGKKSGFFPGFDEFATAWRLVRRFEPNMSDSDRDAKHAGWKDAVRRAQMS